MADSKITGLTSLTGANVVDADVVPIVDVSDTTMAASGTNKKITAAQLAQSPQFASRYAPLAGDSVRWIDAPSLHVTAGSAVIGNPALNNGNGAAWLMDSATTEIVAGSVLMPSSWTTFRIDLYHTNQASTSGNVVWQMVGNFAGSGNNVEISLLSVLVNSTQIIAAPTTASQIAVTQFGGTLTNDSTKVFFFQVSRLGANANDTLANDAGVYGVLFTKLS